LKEGGIVVADGGTLQIHYFDAEGGLRALVGGRGRGPGEFEALSLLGVTPQDSVFVWDRSQARLTVIDPGGTIVRAETLRPPTGSLTPMPRGVFPDGSLLASFPSLMARTPTEGMLVRDSVRLWRYHPSSGERERLVTFPSGEVFFWRGDSYQVPFGLSPVSTLHGDELFAIPGTEHEVHVYTHTGRMRMRMRHVRPPVAVSDEEAEAVRRLQLERAPPSNADPAGAVRRLPIPSHRPVYGEILVDEEGNVWARRLNFWIAFIDPDTEEPGRWSIFSADGVLLGEVTVPPGVFLQQVNRSDVVALWYDDTGVPFVHVYPLHKPEG
jgi:hypothetical protein